MFAVAFMLVASFGEPHGPYVQVSTKNIEGADVPALADAVSRVLLVTGATVVVGPQSRVQCSTRCVQLTVWQLTADHFRLEARQ